MSQIDSLAAPDRKTHELIRMVVTVALRNPPGVQRHARLAHEVDERELRSGLNIVQFKDGVMIGASDPRRDGIALGE